MVRIYYEKGVAVMRHKRFCLILAVVFIFTMGLWTAMAAGLAEQHATLSGKVVMVVGSGATVQEGDELVRVETLAGATTAALATVSGIVKEVLVGQGSMVKSGDVVVKIEPK